MEMICQSLKEFHPPVHCWRVQPKKAEKQVALHLGIYISGVISPESSYYLEGGFYLCFEASFSTFTLECLFPDSAPSKLFDPVYFIW